MKIQKGLAETRIKFDAERFCYTILMNQFDENGYIPSAVLVGEKGHYPMMGQGEYASPWYWGKTYGEAVEVCKAKNEEMGISEKEAIAIVEQSFWGKV